MRRRFRRRLATAAGLGILLGGLFTLFVWGGYRGYHGGWLDPAPFSEAWQAFPLIGGFIFVTYMLWPWRHSGE